MPTFVKIKAIKSSLSNSETKIADFILNSPNTIRELSSQELAKVTNVSQSSIIKFTQKLGYKGYPAFKLAIIDTLNKNAPESLLLHGKITLSDSIPLLAEKLLNSKLSALNETKNLNDQKTYERVIEQIKTAKRICICGLGGSALVGIDFAHKLQRLGMSAIASSDGHSQLAYITTFSKNDLVFVISESGETREIIAITEQAKKNGVQVISLTKYGNNPVSANANIKLYSIEEKESLRLSSIIARTSQEFVIDMLFIAITQSSQQGRKLLQETSDAIKAFRR